MQRLRTLLGLAKPTLEPAALAAVTHEPVIQPVAAERFAGTVPAVAGYSYRIEKIDHMLAARLQSVARLNAPAGRKPYAKSARVPGAVPVPQARIGAKKTRAAQSGLRVLRPAAPRPAAQVIQFPVRQHVEVSAGERAMAA